VAWLPLSAGAQRFPGPLDDASVLRPGVVRLDALFGVASADQRFGLNTPGRRDGSLEPLAADFAITDLGVAQLPALAAAEQRIRALAAQPAFTLSLGRPIVSSVQNSTSTPIAVDIGIAPRLMIGVMVPYVKTRNAIGFDFNPAGGEGNVGVNPALAAGIARTTNTTFRDQVTVAAAQLRAALDFCAANPGSGNCPTLEANRTAAEALIAESRGFRDQVDAVYGSDTTTSPSVFVPRAASPAQVAIDARASAINAQYRTLLGLTASSPDPIAARPFASQTPVTAGQAQALFTDANSPFGTGIDALRLVERSHIGDVEASAKLLLFDSFSDTTGVGLRSAIGATYRFATGQEDDPDDLFDVPTGDGQNDVEIRTALDIRFARRVATSFRARYTIQLADETVARIPRAAGDIFPPAYSAQLVERDLGDIIEIDAVPRYAISANFSIIAQYLLRRKAEDRYTGSFTIPGTVTGIGDIELDASTLQAETEATEHRVGAGFTYSMSRGRGRGTVRWPFEISYMHGQTIRGSGGNQPKWALDILQVRIVASLLGR
jgi:hypothetical protein